MNKIDSLEIFLYLFPIFQIIIIQLFFRPYLQYKNKINLSVSDTLLPILLVGIHIISVRWVAFSLLPYYLFALCIIGLMLTFYYEKSSHQLTRGKVFSIIMKVAFLTGFLMYYAIVLGRIIQLLRG